MLDKKKGQRCPFFLSNIFYFAFIFTLHQAMGKAHRKHPKLTVLPRKYQNQIFAIKKLCLV